MSEPTRCAPPAARTLDPSRLAGSDQLGGFQPGDGVALDGRALANVVAYEPPYLEVEWLDPMPAYVGTTVHEDRVQRV